MFLSLHTTAATPDKGVGHMAYQGLRKRRFFRVTTLRSSKGKIITLEKNDRYEDNPNVQRVSPG
jgi:hypothetical protein